MQQVYLTKGGVLTAPPPLCILSITVLYLFEGGVLAVTPPPLYTEYHCTILV